MALHDEIKIGDIFDRLSVISQPYKINNRWYTDCKCSCGNEKKRIRIESLKRGTTRSCGCLMSEHMTLLGSSSKKYNHYKLNSEYGIGFTNNTNKYGENFFLFDLEDYDKIKNFCWCFDKDGYVFSMKNGSNIKMHRLIMNCPINLEVDHVYYSDNGKDSKNDNRKENLKICSHKHNCQNRIDKSTGVINTRKGYKAYKNSCFIGIYDSYEKAKKAISLGE